MWEGFREGQNFEIRQCIIHTTYIAFMVVLFKKIKRNKSQDDFNRLQLIKKNKNDTQLDSWWCQIKQWNQILLYSKKLDASKYSFAVLLSCFH